MIQQYHSGEKRNSCKHLKFKGVCCSRGPEVSSPVVVVMEGYDPLGSGVLLEEINHCGRA